jgi:hypothetical protein
MSMFIDKGMGMGQTVKVCDIVIEQRSSEP